MPIPSQMYRCIAVYRFVTHSLVSIHVQGAISFSGGQTSVEVQQEWVRNAPLETAAQSGLQEE